MRRHLRSLGPLGPVLGRLPVARVQLRGAKAFANAGLGLSHAGAGLITAARSVDNPSDPTRPTADAVGGLRRIDGALRAARSAIDAASMQMGALDGYRLLGPLGSARLQLEAKLNLDRKRVADATQGVDALVAFAGGSGPRRYLILSQNPDEVRPTGGFIGTYGVLSVTDGHLSLDRYDAIERWLVTHRSAEVPPSQSPAPFQVLAKPIGQSLANVNDTGDWVRAAQLAETLWARGDEIPVDGVLSMTPDFLARLLGVVGAVAVPGYDETVDATNAVAQMDFHAHHDPAADAEPGGRKQFIAALAGQVVHAVLRVPASRWRELGRVVAAGFDAREAMAYADDVDVQTALVARHWDGSLPDDTGDFFAAGEFEYSAKNGRGLRRTFDHAVAVRADGGATVTTRITIANTDPPGPLNVDSLAWVAPYGPLGATLDPASDPVDARLPLVDGRPTAGWLRGADPGSTSTTTVVWQVPRLLVRDGNRWLFAASWWPLPDHAGDTLHVHVTLPPGWGWAGVPPPSTYAFDAPIRQRWVLTSNRK
ncbi:MAG: hypothetical protein NVS3B12_33660 [Acidimicrobiales bacterium]